MKKPNLKKLKTPEVIHQAKRVIKRDVQSDKAPDTSARITNETVAEHREEVLSSARKYIYPLPHSKHRIVKLSVMILVTAVVCFFVWCMLALYRFQSTSAFVYDVTRIIPFPVAKVGGNFVSYESYLFELRHYIHYYETQQQANFSTAGGKIQLTNYKKQMMQDVINNAYVNQLAAQYHVSVSDQEVNNEVTLIREENRLGSSQQVFSDVLKEFYGWTINDFKRELKQQLLAQKVVAALDTGTEQRAQQALAKINKGAKFEDVAKQMSDDASTRNHGGQYPGLVSAADRNIPPQVTAALFKLKPGQHSGIINSGYTLEIVKVVSDQGDKVKAEHIEFDFKDISSYIKPLQAKNPPHQYIHF